MKVFMDNVNTTKMDEDVFKVMKSHLLESKNTSGLYDSAQKADKAIRSAQKIVAKALNVSPDEIVFTSSGTEANNLAIKGTALANKDKGNHLIVSKVEHPSITATCLELERKGFELDYVDVDSDGFVYPEQIEKLIKPETILVSVIHVNHEVGTIEPIEEISKVLEGLNHNVCFHSDISMSFGKMNINTEGIDLLTMSSQKIHGPKGVGALFVRKGTSIKNIMHGIISNFEIRPGSENVPAIVGFGKATEIAMNNMDENFTHVKKLHDRLARGIKSSIPEVILNGPKTKKSPYILNASFKRIEGEAIALRLNEKGIEVATGSRCAERKLRPNPTLIAMGLSEELAHGSIRFGLSKFNTQKDIEYILEVLPKVVFNLRELSPF